MRLKITLFLLFLIFLILFESGSVFSQATQSDWVRTYGGSTDDYPTDLIMTNDGGYIVLGSTSVTTGYGPTDVCWVIKLDSMGNVEWNKTYTEEAGLVYAQKISATEDGGYLLTGDTVVSDKGLTWVAKLDSSGNLLWGKTYGEVSGSPLCAVQNSEGGFILTGFRNEDGLIINIDAQGNTQWVKTAGGSKTDSLGNAFLTPDGNYVIGGSTFSFGAGNTDYWLLCIDPSGNELWNKTYGYPSYDSLGTILQTSRGGYIMAGSTMFNNGGVLVIKTSSTGTMEWNRTYSSSGSPFDMMETSDGGFILTCSNSVFKIDLLGNLQWTKNYNADVRCMVRAVDGGYILTGCVSKDYGNRDIWLAKIDGAGDIQSLPESEIPDAIDSPYTTPQTLEAAKIDADSGTAEIVTVTVTGNISAPQMSSLTLSENQTEGSATVSMLVTGTSGTVGFGNITISKTLIIDSLVPEVYIDGQKAENQGFTQDSENYYVWFTTHFSTHELSLTFKEQEEQQLPDFFWAILLIVTVVVVGFGLVVYFKKRKH